MAQYKFPTTVGEVEFKELGSDEVSFNLQFYNNKDANLEHIETTPHKVNGLELQNLEKSEVDQLCDEIKRLVSGYYYLDSSKSRGIASKFSEMIVLRKDGNWFDGLGFKVLKWFVKMEMKETIRKHFDILGASIDNHKAAKSILDNLKKQLDDLENESSKKGGKDNLEDTLEQEKKNTLKQTIETLDGKVNQLKTLEEKTQKTEGNFKKTVEKNDVFETSFLFKAKRNLFTPKNYQQNFDMKFETTDNSKQSIQESIPINFSIAPAGWAMVLFSILGGLVFLMASLVVNPDYLVEKTVPKTDAVFENQIEREIFINGLRSEINDNAKFLSIEEERLLKDIISKITKNTETFQNQLAQQAPKYHRNIGHKTNQYMNDNPIIKSIFLVIVMPPIFFTLFVRFGRKRFAIMRNNIIYPFAIGSIIGLGHKSIPVLLESIRSGSVNQFNRILRSISSTNISMKEIINSSAEQFSFLQQFIDLV